MDKSKKMIIEVVDAPEISLSDMEKAGDVLLKFYKALGWNAETEMLDPCKVRTTQAVYNYLYDIMLEKYNHAVSVGMFMVNTGPGVDADVPAGKVYLLDGWIAPCENENREALNESLK